MIATAHQTAYMPWLGLLHKISCADVYVVLDDVQHSHGSFENRNRVMTTNGPVWLTVPLRQPRQVRIRDLRVDNTQPWRGKHWKTIQQAYGKAPYWSEHQDFLKWFYEVEWDNLVDMNDAVTRYLMNKLNLTTRIVRQSELGATGTKTDLIVDACKKAGCWKFVFGASGPEYLDPTRLGGIEAYVQRFEVKYDWERCWAFDIMLRHGLDVTLSAMQEYGKLERVA